MRIALLPLLIAALPGCGGGAVEDVPPEECDRIPYAGTFSADASAQMPAGSVTVGLHPVEVVDGDLLIGPPSYGQDVGAVAAGSSADFAFCLPSDPDAADIWHADGGDEVALFILGAEVDGVAIGAEASMLLWVQDDPTSDLVELGGAGGWNLYTHGYDGEFDQAATALGSGDTAVAFEANLVEHAPESLDGTFGDALGVAAVQVDMLLVEPQIDAPLGTLATVAADGSSMGNAFAFAGLPGPPPDHLTTEPDLEAIGLTGFGFYTVVAYIDADASGAWNEGEQMLAHSAQETAADPREVVYVEAGTFQAGPFLAAYGLRVGWTLATPHDTPVGPMGLTWSDGVVLQPEVPAP